MTIEILALIILTLLSAFFSCSEVAFFSLSPARIKKLRLDTSATAKRLSEILLDSRSLLVTIFMLNTIVNVLVQNVSSDLFDSPTGGWALKIGLPVVLLLLFGELIPKYLGMVWSTFFSQIAAIPFWYIQKIFSPFRKVVLSVTEFFTYPFIQVLKDAPKPGFEEIEELLTTSGKEGILSLREADLLKAFVEIDQDRVKEIMTPKQSLKIISKNQLLKEKKANSESDYIVVDENIDKPIGFVKGSELKYIHSLPENVREKEIAPLLYVPEMMPVGALCFKMFLEGYEMACVVDEYGLFVGGVERTRLYDMLFSTAPSSASNPHIIKLSHDQCQVSGLIPIEDINELFTVELESKFHQVTLNGWLAETLGRIPHQGTRLASHGLEFRILESNPKASVRIEIKRMKGAKHG